MQPKKLFEILLENYGQQYWWPAKSNWEVIVGAILTQNTSWIQVEKAIANLKAKRKLSLNAIQEINEQELGELIKPAGYFNQKAVYLKEIAKYIQENYSGDLDKWFAKDLIDLRTELLGLKGIGPETCDSILLYAAKKPVFVIDAYTKRLSERLDLTDKLDYNDLQEFFQLNLKKNVQLYNEFHALIVNHAKNYCLKENPKCEKCILKKECFFIKK